MRDDIKEIGHLATPGQEARRSPEEILAEDLRRRAEQDLIEDEARKIMEDGL